MASATNTRYNFYRRYLWNEVDFLAFQTAIYGFIKGALEGIFGGAVLTGHKYVAVSGFTIGCASGISVDLNGELLVTTGQTNVVATDPTSGHTKKCLVVARSVVTDNTSIARPTSPFDSVFLKELYGCTIALIESANDASSFPAKVAGDVILFGVNTDHSGIVSTDYSVREVGLPTKHKITKVSATYQILSSDEIIEVTTGNSDVTVTLPVASTVPNQRFTVVKVDSGTGTVIVAAAANISGQASQVVDSQYGSLGVYSNAATYYQA